MLAGGARAGNDPDNVPKAPDPDSDHDVLSALDQWVERGTPPSRIIALRHMPGSDDRSIPVCAYPLTAQLIKGGNAKDASGFRCIDQRGKGGKQ
jgi:feruloyl esterase